MSIQQATNHFIDFHQGAVNVVIHVLGFAGLFYSIYKLNWILFGIAILVLESGHVYNHFAGIKKYDFRPKILLWRVVIFLVVVLLAYLINHYVFVAR